MPNSLDPLPQYVNAMQSSPPVGGSAVLNGVLLPNCG